MKFKVFVWILFFLSFFIVAIISFYNNDSFRIAIFIRYNNLLDSRDRILAEYSLRYKFIPSSNHFRKRIWADRESPWIYHQEIRGNFSGFSDKLLILNVSNSKEIVSIENLQYGKNVFFMKMVNSFWEKIPEDLINYDKPFSFFCLNDVLVLQRTLRFKTILHYTSDDDPLYLLLILRSPECKN